MEEFVGKDLYLPFLSTVGASLTIILLGTISRRSRETKKKIYASSYIIDVCYRLITSELILLKHTINPHIAATEKIIEGDEKLLGTMFLSDEFDILTAGPTDFSHLPSEYKLLMGVDNIELVQLFDTLNYLHKNDTNRSALNQFVKDNLKSMHDFLSLHPDKQTDVLYTYHDYLTSLQHESRRMIAFILTAVAPSMRDYLKSYQFWLYRKKTAKAMLKHIQSRVKENRDLIPENDYMENVKHGGIQSEVS